MTVTAERILAEATQLSLVERRLLIEGLSHTLPALTDAEWEAAWAPEIEHRLADLDAGRTKAISLAEFLSTFGRGREDDRAKTD